MQNTNHDKLVEEAKQAINNVFSDMSVCRAQTTESLKDLIDDIEIMLDALKNT
jgi:hypothetical protein